MRPIYSGGPTPIACGARILTETDHTPRADNAGFDKWCVAGFAFCSILLLVRLLNHAFWRDEAQAWLIAVHAESLTDLIILQSEGHPPLYHWLLYALNAFGEQLWLIKIPQGLFAVGSLALVWFATPFGRLEKLLISLGYYLSYQYGIISRPYIVGFFFCLVYVCWYRQWLSRPMLAGIVLGLVALTQVLFAFVASALCLPLLLAWWRDKTDWKRLILFSLVFGSCALFSVVSARLSMSRELLDVYAGDGVTVTELVNSMIRQITVAFFHGVPADRGVLTILACGLLILSFVSAPFLGFVFLLGAIAVSAFVGTIYGGAPWHNGTIYVLLISLYGIGYARMHSSLVSRKAIVCLLALSFVGNVRELPGSLTTPYSAGETAASLIAELGLTDSAWAAYSDQTATVTFAALERPVFGLRCGCVYTFVDWVKYRLPTRTLKDNLQAFVAQAPSGEAYLLVSKPQLAEIQKMLDDGYSAEHLAETGESRVHNETFVLLKVGRL